MSALVVGVKEGAEMLSISRWSYRQLIAAGLLPTIDLPSSKYPGERGRRVLVAVSDIEAFIAAHRSDATVNEVRK